MRQARVLNEVELKRVLAVINMGKYSQRNRLALLLSHYAGLRVGEIATLKWSDVNETDGSVKSVFYLDAENTKSNEARAVHLNQILMKEVALGWRSYSLHPNLDDAVIQSQKGKSFSANTLCQLFSRLYASAGLDGATSHSGRRWFITKLAHSGVSPKVIMELAGHKHLGTTQRYIEVNEEMKSQAVALL
ncbi:site-specific integrase [Lentilitoribacter sp. Alg239-R112]|uniref:tyrosine-type recombinase/integrase n=1 Tax=Lentilitoribacter sp. Alg239-R112 TaxID=2305987 RepID=UPI0013A6C7A9|nr:site-specific integrase [Lentilitoribacter sp. Alg239-R112]